jgi:hypothetical protein
MLDDLSRRWARFVARDKHALLFSKISLANSGVFFLLYFTLYPNPWLFGVAAMLLFLSLMLFERAGMIQLLRDGSRPEGRRGADGREDNLPGMMRQ